MESDKDSNIERFQYSTTTTNTNEHKPTSLWRSAIDSFKPAIPDHNEHILKTTTNKDHTQLTDIEKININAANSNLQRKLKTRHLQMISIGSSIGTGLFVGTGQALANGGPAAIVLAWVITATAVFATMQGLGELAVTFPVSGGFNLYASKFIEPGIGFAVGWNYFLQFFVLLPLELVAGAITVKYWNSSINSDVFVIIFWVLIVILTNLPVKFYGEAEFVFSMVKVLAVIGFIILGIVLICGGGPTHTFVGGKYWRSPGPFSNGFKGFASVLVTASFSYGGTEMIALTASESKNVRQSLPKAIKQVFWRIVIFYLGSITMIACLVPYNDTRLFGQSSVDASASAFTIAIVNGGIKGLPSVINAVILISVLSVGNASVYACSRSLNSLAEQGMAPKKWTGYIDRAGRPLAAIWITDIFGLFALIAAKNDAQEKAFDWLLALSGLSSIFTWMSINICHLRFRRAMTVQQRSLDELPFTSQVGVWGSWYGLILNALFLIAQFYIALFPLGGKPNAYDFFLSYLGFPVVVASWVGYKLWKRNWTIFIRAKDIDIDTGRVNVDLDVLRQEIAEEKARLAEKPFYIRFYRFWC